jgi:Fe-S oxidoreductase
VGSKELLRMKGHTMENLEKAVKLASQAIESARVADGMHRQGFPEWSRFTYLKSSREVMKANLLVACECLQDSEMLEAARAFVYVSALLVVIESHLAGA